MEKIFSRRRIRLPKVEKLVYKENTERKTKILMILIIAIMSAITIISRFNPVFNSICSNKAKSLATEIINQKSNDTFKNVNYEGLVDIVKDENR